MSSRHVCEESPFYPEGGGQVSDPGWIENEETGTRAELVRAIRLVGEDQALTLPGKASRREPRARGRPLEAPLPDDGEPHGDAPFAPGAARGARRPRPTGGLRRASRQAPLRLHPSAVADPDEREAVEQIVNERVFENLPVRAFVTPIEEARKLGAMMLFGEKYGDEVRVIEIPGFSRELCGGTHVRWTAEIGPFEILSESSVGAARGGSRRLPPARHSRCSKLGRGRLDELRGELARVRKETRTPKEDEAADFYDSRP